MYLSGVHDAQPRSGQQESSRLPAGGLCAWLGLRLVFVVRGLLVVPMKSAKHV